MKNKILLSIIIIFFAATGCEKFLDVNHDPNNLEPEYVSVDLVLPAALENNASILGSYGLVLGEIWAQHWTSDANAPQFQNEDSYQITAGDYNYDLGIWRGLYAGALKDYEFIKEKSLVDSNWNFYFVATVMQAYTYHVLVDLFDQIPVSEALVGNIPKFEAGQEVYDTLIARIDYAMAQNFDAETNMELGDADLILDGSITTWIAFANTLKLKMYLRQVYVNPDVVQNNIQPLLDNGVFLTTDVKFDDFSDEVGRDNYMYAYEFRSGNTNIRASKTLLDYLDDENDDRLPFIYKPTSSGALAGMYQGDYRNEYSYPGVSSPDVSSPRVTATMPFYFMSLAEVNFLLAEAYLLVGNVAQAQTYYEAAIIADVNRLNSTFLSTDDELEEIDPEDIYTGYADFTDATTDEEMLELIIVQKWIALANIGGLEMFFEHNRTGYPRESAVVLGDDNFFDDYIVGQWTPSVTGVLTGNIIYPKRLLFPSTEQNKNPNTPTVVPLNTPVWWDVKEYTY